MCCIFALSFQELSPTSDTNLVKSLMNLMDCMMDEFHDEAEMRHMNEKDICSWLEVSIIATSTTAAHFYDTIIDNGNIIITPAAGYSVNVSPQSYKKRKKCKKCNIHFLHSSTSAQQCFCLNDVLEVLECVCMTQRIAFLPN